MADMIIIDGAHGEGGGQIVRTALALSTITQKSFTITDIRKGRSNPGLKMQHLFGIKALEALCGATSVGAELGAASLDFTPAPINERTVDIDIGTAGSITLLLQGVLLPCLFAKRPVKLRIIGGTDVAWSMPIDFFKDVFVPHLQKVAEVRVSLQKRGYYPKGQGIVEILVVPRFSMDTSSLKLELQRETYDDDRNLIQIEIPTIQLMEQGELQNIKGISHASSALQKNNVAERQALAAASGLKKLGVNVGIQTEYSETPSVGSGITVWAQYATLYDEIDEKNPVRIGADQLGEKMVRAEVIGEAAAKKLLAQVERGAPVDANMADNLIPLLGLLGGEMKVSEVTEHVKSNIYVTELFLGKRFEVDGNVIRVNVNS